MLNAKQIFQTFDKGNKNYLTKHETKLALIYNLGFKIRYDELKKIWKERLDFKEYKLKDNYLLSKGITEDYFTYIIEKTSKSLKLDKRLEIDFKAIDQDQQGNLTYQQFSKLLQENNINFLQESNRSEIFSAIDFDKDGKISYQDYLLSMKKGLQNQN